MPQTGLCDINIAAVDITVPALFPPLVRPPKRPFTEIDDGSPGSDEMYGWVEEDQLGTEGLLINEVITGDIDAAESRTGSQTGQIPEHSKKVTRIDTA